MGWRVKGITTEEHIQCSLSQVPIVFIEPLPKQKIEILMDTYPHNEWTAYLVGKVSEKGNVFVEDIVVPPHAYIPTAGSAEVAAPEYNKTTGVYKFHVPDRCVGFLHSHDSLGAFHSGTDDAHVDKNYPVSVTVAKRSGTSGLEFDTVSYVVTPCGKATIGKPVVKYVAPKPQFDTGDWLKEARKNIERAEIKESRKSLVIGRNEKGLIYQGDKSLIDGKPIKTEIIRNNKGRFAKRAESQRKMFGYGSSDDIFTDENGRVMSKKEVEVFLEERMNGG